MPDYDGYSTAAEFHQGYDNFITPEVVAKWDAVFRAESERALAALPDWQALRYGPGERNAIDFFPARNTTGPAPVLVAIHGGLWFLFDKWVMHFLAPAFVDAGVHVACVNYGLAPAQNLSGIVADARRAVAFLQEQADELKLDPARLSVLGHSAAGQMAALAAAPVPNRRHPVHACIGVSGFYDIEPFAETGFHPSTQFPPEEYRAWNPLRHVSPDFPRTLLITGSRESSLLQQMMAHFASALRGQGVAVEARHADGHCHFSVLHEIGDPKSALFQRVVALCR